MKPSVQDKRVLFYDNASHKHPAMKQKLREACVEVLKKTEDAEPEHMSWQYDDDARFLD